MNNPSVFSFDVVNDGFWCGACARMRTVLLMCALCLVCQVSCWLAAIRNKLRLPSVRLTLMTCVWNRYRTSAW